MILPLGGLLVGAILGAGRARQKGGNGLDMAQWAAVCALIGAILGLFTMIALQRSVA